MSIYCFLSFCRFQDENGECFVAIDNIAIPIESEEFGNYLRVAYCDTTGKIADDSAISNVKKQLKATTNKTHFHVNIRINRLQDWFIYDPLNDDGTVYYITNSKWALWKSGPNTVPPTTRREGMLPAIVDTSGDKSSMDELLGRWNLSPSLDVRVKGFICTLFVPDIAHVILMVTGEAGSAKTGLTGAIKTIFDPFVLKNRILPKEIRELAIAAKYENLISFDNVNSMISPELCNAISSMVTGGGTGYRKLYTNDEQINLKLNRSVMMNSINPSTNAPDLLERADVWTLEPINLENRLTDIEMKSLIDDFAPKIRGYILTNVLPNAIKLYPEVCLDLKGKLPRMADYTLWAEACCRAMGYPPLSFYNAFVERQAEMKKENIENTFLYESLTSLVIHSGTGIWVGSTTELFNKLREYVILRYDDKNMLKSLPATPARLGRDLRNYASSLRACGFDVEYPRKRTICLKLNENWTKPDPYVVDSKNGIVHAPVPPAWDVFNVPNPKQTPDKPIEDDPEDDV